MAVAIRAEQSDNDSVDECRLRFYFYWVVCRILRDKNRTRTSQCESLQGGFAVDGDDNDVSGRRKALLADNYMVSLQNTSAGHAVTGDAKCEELAGCTPTRGNGEVSVNVLVSGARYPGRDSADDGNAPNLRDFA